MLPSVTVIVLNYNGKEYLSDCLTSLFALDYPGESLEVLVVDNGSSDGSGRYLAENFPSAGLIQLSNNVGFAKGNNIGAQSATGEYLALLNNDMRVDQHWLSRMVEAIQAEDDVACVGSKILTWDGKATDFTGGVLNFYGMGFQPESDDSSDDLRETLFACGGAILIERQVFTESGGFDEDYFAYFEDVDLGWRLWVLGYRVLLVPQAVAYHRGHATGKKFAAEKRALLYERNALYTIIKNYGDEALGRVLPVALLLTARRSTLMSGVDKRGFRMEAEQLSSSIWPPSRCGSRLAEGHIRRELRTLLDEFGLWVLLKEVFRRILRWFYVRSVVQIKRGVAFVPRESLSPLMALDDVAEMLPVMWDRRQEIQSRRRRDDVDILPLFGEPFHPHPSNSVYLELQQSLARLFGIVDLFGDSENTVEVELSP